MKTATARCLSLMLTLLIAPIASFCQDQPAPVAGVVELGSRWSWGDVYGRPDLPFDPSLKSSKYNEYRDLRDGFFVPRVRLSMDDLAGSKYFLDVQSNNSIYRDQSYLATFGQWNRFKVQFRYDEIPHTYTNTARTLYTQTSQGYRRSTISKSLRWLPTPVRSSIAASSSSKPRKIHCSSVCFGPFGNTSRSAIELLTCCSTKLGKTLRIWTVMSSPNSATCSSRRGSSR